MLFSYFFKRCFLLSLLLLGFFWSACQSVPPCTNQVGSSTLNTQKRGCGEDCDCNNQRFVGRCVQGVCESIARETCFQTGRKRYCELDGVQPLDKRCEWGVQICQDEGLYALYWGDCKPQSPAEQENTRELCVDGIDNDCNKRTDFYADESCKEFCLVGSSEPCYDWKEGTAEKPFPGYRPCKLGTKLCKEDNTWGECIGAIYPEAEICDGKDNDCNGMIDENLQGCAAPVACQKGETQPCYNHLQGCVVDAKGVWSCQGQCKTGLRTCTDNQMWGECIGQVGPSFEDCNQVDDNCNGLVDEGCVCSPKTTQPCYAGTPSTRGKGRCQDGIQNCQRGFWGSCEGSTSQRQEECNGEDDDCNGVIDDPEKLIAPPCEKRLGVCLGAVKRCGGVRGWLPCTSEDYQRADPSYVADDGEGKDHCDGKDNDCDGKIDEGCSGSCITGSVKACYNGPNGTQGQGACRDGLQICKDGAWGDCLLQVLPTTEICNNSIDDDCNGLIDDCKAEPTAEPQSEPQAEPRSEPQAEPQSEPQREEVAEGGQSEPSPEIEPEKSCVDGEKRPCSLGGVGVCKDGESTCSAGIWGACIPIDPQLNHELCDGKDNDCNGLIDEGYALRPQPPLCNNQEGACLGARLRCSPSVYEPAWSQITSGNANCTDADYKAHSNDVRLPAPASGDEDRCDGIDNDCDGQVDEGCPWIRFPNNGVSDSPRIVVGKDAQNKDILYAAASIRSNFSMGLFTGPQSQDRRLFIARYNQTGALDWTFFGDAPPSINNIDANARGLALDPTQQYLYVLFDYLSTIKVGSVTLRASDIGGGTGSGGGGRDIGLIKLDAQTGALVWATNIGGVGEDQGHSLHVDAAGDIYLSVNYRRDIDFQPTHQNMIIDTNQSLQPIINDSYLSTGLIKLTEQAGRPKLVWITRPQNTTPYVGDVGGTSLSTDASGQLWWLGYARSNHFQSSFLRFGVYALPLLTNNINKLFLARLNATTGEFTAALRLEGTTPSVGYSLAVHNNQVTIAGTFEGTVSFQTSTGPKEWKSWGREDTVILRLGQITNSTDPTFGEITTPTWEWVTHIGTIVGNDRPRHLYADATGSVYVVGRAFEIGVQRFFLGSQNATNPQPPTLQPTGFGNDDGYVAKLNSSGQVVWGGLIGTLNGANLDALSAVFLYPQSDFLYLAGEVDHGILQLGSRTHFWSSKTGGNSPTFFLWQIGACPANAPLSLDCFPK